MLVFHISFLKKRVGDLASIVPNVAVKYSLTYEVVTVEIIDH